MATLSVLTWIGNAAAVLCGPWGAVSRQARQAGCSRQAAYDQAQRVHQAVADAQAGGPSREQLLQETQRLQEENRQLWQALEDTIDFGPTRQQRFVVTAAALGLSDRLIVVLLELLLGARHPSRATVGRWVQTWSQKASRLLQALDQGCCCLVRTLCLDEIFCGRRPILVGVEPHSLVCVLARQAADRSAATWQEALRLWDRLEQVLADAACGLHKGLQQWQQARRQAGSVRRLDVGLDLFHTCQEAQRVLRRLWGAAERVWKQWDPKQAAYDRLRWRGVDCHSREYHRAAQQASRARARAEQALTQAERQEQAWRRARAAFELFRPDGPLNDRAWAEAEIAAALPALPTPSWSKVRNFLGDPRSLNFLDRLHRELAAAEPRADVRAALVQLWRWQQESRRGRSPGQAAPAVAAAAVQAALGRELGAAWLGCYRQVAQVLRETVRASSAVECLNSVWRMHQARHRRLTQGLLDLKRLYWNSRVFVEGKRRGQSPYRLLGLRLPTYDPWELLQLDPDVLAQQVSTPELAA
jgi:hypothetical protein